MKKGIVNRNSSRAVELIKPEADLGSLKQKHINISDDIELISFKHEESCKETDVENMEANTSDLHETPYYIMTPKSPLEETFYGYSTATQGHSISTPGTVVSDFDLDHTDFEELGQERKVISIKKPAVLNDTSGKGTNEVKIMLSQLQANTRNNLLNEIALFMSLENKKINKLDRTIMDLETKHKVLENIPKLLSIKKDLKIPLYLVKKLQAGKLASSKNNSLKYLDQLVFNKQVKHSVSPLDTHEADIRDTDELDNQHLLSETVPPVKSSARLLKGPKMNTFCTSLVYMKGSGIVGVDAKNAKIFKRNDGILIVLKCSRCNKADFVSPQGIMNHYRFKHEEVKYPNQTSCLLENMEYYNPLQSNVVLLKFRELGLDPKKSFLPFNVAFKEPIDLLAETAESLDEKIEFFKILDLGSVNNIGNRENRHIKTDIKVGKNGKVPTGNFFNINSGTKKSSGNNQTVQFFSSGNRLKIFLKDNKTDSKIVDDTNKFILDYIPVELENELLASDSSNYDHTLGLIEKVIKKRKLSNETQIMASLPDRKGKRKISIPKRLLED